MENLVFLDSVKTMPVMKLPVRSTLASLKNAQILISPGSALTKEQLRTLPEVTDIVAPNLLHSGGVKKACDVFPQAKTWAAHGLIEKKPKVPWSAELNENTWPYHEELALINMQGMPKLNEAVFVHRLSKTLIVCDLCFDVTNPKGLGAWLIFNMFGTYRRFAVSKFLLKLIKDKKQFQESLHKLFSFDFDNIVVGHGQPIIGNGRKRLLAALEERDLFPN